MTYSQVPLHYKWENGKWVRRKKHMKILPRINDVSPLDREKFALRILLFHVISPTSFTDLRTDAEGIVHDSFHACALARGLLDDDNEWRVCLQEASGHAMPSSLRVLFATICTICNASKCFELWDEFKQFLTEDFRRQFDGTTSEQSALHDIKMIVNSTSSSDIFQSLDLPLDPLFNVAAVRGWTTNDSAENSQDIMARDVPLLNAEQRLIYDTIMSFIDTSTSGVKKFISMDGPGGSGKTFLYNTILHTLRSRDLKFISVAWTGVAAMLLLNGKTSHVGFRLPLNIDEATTISVPRGSKIWNEIAQSSVTIWDEISLVPKNALDAVDRMQQRTLLSLKIVQNRTAFCLQPSIVR